MKLSELFGSTLRKAPADAESASYRWLARGGYIRASDGGNFVTLPLAQRSLNKLRARLRHEMGTRGGQEIGPHAALIPLAAADIQSWRQLPQILFAFEEIVQAAHPRLGLFGAAHSPGVSIHALTASQPLQEKWSNTLNALFKDFFEKMDIAAHKTDCGGYAFLTESGGADYIRCPQCGYLDTQDFARQSKSALSAEEPRAPEKVATPDAHSIDALSAFLNIPKEKTAKAVFMVASLKDGAEKLIFAVLRGDMDLSEAKLMNALGASALRPATDAEIRAVDAVPGYASPIGVKDVLIVADDLIPESPNLVAGANEEGVHLRNVNYGRDYAADIVADLALTQAGQRCPNCNAALAQVSGVALVGATRPRAAEAAAYTDENGKGQPIWTASWTLDLGRTLAAVAESHHDEYGLLWPPAVTPYDIHLIWLPSKTMNTRTDADDLYINLTNTGFSVLYDDREARAGAKFNDADLIGCPVRITVGEKALQTGNVEIKLRAQKEKALVALDDIANYVLENL